MAPASGRTPVNIAAWLSAETDNGKGVLRGLAQLTRTRAEVHVLKFAKQRPLLPEMIRARSVHGVIATIDSPEEIAELRALRLPVVNVSGRVAIAGVPTVNTDDTKVGQWAARYFLDRGFRTLAYCGNETHTGSCIRERAMRREVTDRGGVFFTYNLAPGEITMRDPGTIIRRLGTWLSKIPKPVGVFAFSDDFCVHLTEACFERDIRIPEDVAILGVGTDSTRLAFSLTTISSVELNSTQIGLSAGQMLLDLIAGRRPRELEVLVPPLKVVTRHSTDRFAVDDELIARTLDFIRENVGNAISVSDIARAVASSRRRLEVRFRAALGRSIYEEVQRLRHERAVELMSDGGLSLAEIADAAGYRNPRHLSVAFRTRVNSSPSEFRAERFAMVRGGRIRRT